MLIPKIDFYSRKIVSNFDQRTLHVFKYQSKYNPVYREYLREIGVKSSKIKSITEIPFLPIRFFKTRKIKTGDWKEEMLFRSSGTTGEKRSKNYVKDIGFYLQSSLKTFEDFYGPIQSYSIYALIPKPKGGLGNSSLLTMVENWIKASGKTDSGFYFENNSELADVLKQPASQNNKRLIIGLSYAFLDFANKFPFMLRNEILMETGGMKGTRDEITRTELHECLKTAFGVKQIHSEYGMAELTSQAYSQKRGLFKPSGLMKILIRDVSDPFRPVTKGKEGGINVIDLGNINTCSFIETQDLGRLQNQGYFEVLGRFDNSDIRGCNLLAS